MVKSTGCTRYDGSRLFETSLFYRKSSRTARATYIETVKKKIKSLKATQLNLKVKINKIKYIKKILKSRVQDQLKSGCLLLLRSYVLSSSSYGLA